MNDSPNISLYPALQRCILVESRFVLRQELYEHLKATNLFHEVIEAESLAHGIELIEQCGANACVVGPGVSPDKAVSFCLKARQNEAGLAVAYLALVKPDHDIEKSLIQAGYNHIFSANNFSLGLFDAVVNAVVKNDPQGNWAKIRLQGAMAYERQLATRDVSQFNRSYLVTSRSLKALSEGIRQNKYGLHLDGRLTSETNAAIDAITSEALGDITDNRELDKLSVQFRSYLVEWVKDTSMVDEAYATQELRQRLEELFDAD